MTLVQYGNSPVLQKLPKQKRQILDDIMDGKIGGHRVDSEPECTFIGFESTSNDLSSGPVGELSLEQLQIGCEPGGGQEKRGGKRKRSNKHEDIRIARRRCGPMFHWNLSSDGRSRSACSTPKRGRSLDRKMQTISGNYVDDAKHQSGVVQDLMSDNKALRNQLDHAKSQLVAADGKLHKMRHSLSQCRQKLIEVLRHESLMDRKLREEKCARDSVLIGRIVRTQNNFGTEISVWEKGERFKDLHAEKLKLETQMEELVQKKKELTSQKKKLRRQTARISPAFKETSLSDHSEFTNITWSGEGFVQSELHLGAQTEIYSLQLGYIKRRQAELEQREKELKLMKHQHIKFLKMMNSEKKSVYQGQLLNDRYLCTKLIGRGGFSEVWKAYDFDRQRDVACKIHALNEKWSDKKKENYTRHATREANIQKGLCHPRIVQLFDVFGIDLNTFCTVLELCEGMDLGVYLNANKPLPEREARSIITQLFEGLMYLAQQKQPIIHYDLKPGNLLYHAGEIKITDFGLSKIMEKGKFEIELTSQGCGTYWYLPPECFVTGRNPPMIGTAVDMWSCGCIFFEMLYGRRPFGHNMTQEKILKEGTVLQAEAIKFPESPKVSIEAKDLIRKCLSRNHKVRPDPCSVLDLHPYFSKLRPTRS